MEEDSAFQFEKVPLEEARELVTKRIVKEDNTHLRAPVDNEPAVLTDEAIAWILALHPSIRPHALARQFPRIANILATLWERPVVFDARLDEYMLDDRGTRQGFPFDVAMDLANLKNVSRMRSVPPEAI